MAECEKTEAWEEENQAGSTHTGVSQLIDQSINQSINHSICIYIYIYVYVILRVSRLDYKILNRGPTVGVSFVANVAGHGPKGRDRSRGRGKPGRGPRTQESIKHSVDDIYIYIYISLRASRLDYRILSRGSTVRVFFVAVVAGNGRMGRDRSPGGGKPGRVHAHGSLWVVQLMAGRG